MPNQQLIDYIKQARAAGQNKEEIRVALLGAEQQAADRDEAFAAVFDSRSIPSDQSNYSIPQDNQITKLPGAFSLLREALFIYKSKFFLFLRILAPLLAIMVIFNTGDYLLPQYIATIYVSIFDAIFIFLLIFTILFCYKAFIHALEPAQEEVGAVSFFKKSGNRFISFVLVAILFCAVVIGAPSIQNIFRILLLGYSFWTYSLTSSSFWLDLLVLVPGYYFRFSFFLISFIFFIWYSFSFFTSIFEGRRGIDALLASARYACGFWHKIVWRYIFSFVIFCTSSIIIILLPILVLFLLHRDISIISALGMRYVIDGVYYIAATPLVIIYSYLIYKNIKRIKGDDVGFISVRWRKIGLLIIITISVLPATFAFFLGFLTAISHDAPLADSSYLRLENIAVPPEEQNAYYYFSKIKDTVEPKDMQDYLSGKKWDEKIVKEILQKNESALSFFDAAAKKEKFQNPAYADPDKISIDMKLTPMNSRRSIARLSSLKALYLFKQGNEREALEESIKIIDVGQKMQDSQGSLIEYLVALAMKDIGLQRVRQVLMQSVTLSPELLSAYANKLERYKNNEDGLQRVWKGEHLISLQVVDSITSHGKLNLFYLQPNRIKNLRTQFIRDQVRDIDIPCAFIKGEIESNDPPEFFRSIITENSFGELLFNAVSGSLFSVDNKKCQEDFAVSSTQLTAALKAYWLENGSYPASLNELAPKYISKVPEDPFDSKLIRYSSEKKIIWSVGKDGIDSGGNEGDDWKTMPDPTFSVDFGVGAVNATTTPVI